MKKIFIRNCLKLEEKTIPTDIGIDLKASSEPKVVGKKAPDGNWSSIDFLEYETNFYVDCLQKNTETQVYADIRPRSSLSKYNLVLANSIGLIDPEYRDQVLVRFKYLFQPKDLKWNADLQEFTFKIDEEKIYKNGDKICQIVFHETIETNFVYVPELAPSRRGFGKFGSTGN